jgi:hypothetical protein
MKFGERADNEFVDAAADDIRRQAKIQELTTRRNLFFWIAWVVTVCALLSVVAEIFDTNRGQHGSGVAAPLFFAAAMEWMLAHKFDSDVRLLKLVEKLKKLSQ